MFKDKEYIIKANLYDGLDCDDDIVFYQNDTRQSKIIAEFTGKKRAAIDVSDCTVVCVIQKSDKEVVTAYMDNNSVSNRAEYVLSQNALASTGKGTITIFVYGSDNERQTFGSIKFKVLKDVNAEGVESTTEYPVLTKLINDTRIVNAEAENIKNEILGISADIANSEKQRVVAEEERKENESNRSEVFNGIKKEYESLKGIMIDENNAANLQNQVNGLGSQLDTNVRELNEKIGEVATTGTTTEAVQSKVEDMAKKGLIQAYALGNGTVEPKKTSFINVVGKNKLDLSEITEAKYITENGSINTAGDSNYCISGYIDISSLDSFKLVKTEFYINFYNVNKQLIRTTAAVNNQIYTRNSDEYFIIITFNKNNQVMVLDGTETDLTYEDYYLKMSGDIISDRSLDSNKFVKEISNAIEAINSQESYTVNVLKSCRITSKWDNGNVEYSITNSINGTLLQLSNNSETSGAVRFITYIDNDNIKNNNYYYIEYEYNQVSDGVIGYVPYITTSDINRLNHNENNMLIYVANNTGNEFSIYFAVPAGASFNILIKKMFIIDFDESLLSYDTIKAMLPRYSNDISEARLLKTSFAKIADFAEESKISDVAKSLSNGKNKKELFLGDSITAEIRVERGWVYWYRQIMTPSSYVNIAVPSATWKNKSDTVLDGNPTSDNLSNNTLCNQVQKVINNINSNNESYLNIERIHIACGVNDGKVNELDKDIEGQFTINDTTNLEVEEVNKQTLPGAMRWSIEKLRKLYPNAQIFIYLPMQAGTGRVNYKNIKELRDVMKDVCDRLAIKYIDSNYCGIYSHYETTSPYLDTEDKIHPNIQGAKKQGLFHANEVIKYNLIDYSLF